MSDPPKRAATDRDRALTEGNACVGCVSGFHRERADLRGFGYPPYTGASCPPTLGSDIGAGDPAPVRNVIWHGPAARSLTVAALCGGALKEQKLASVSSFPAGLVPEPEAKIRSGSGLGHLREQGPDEAGHFPRKGHGNFRFHDPAVQQVPPAFVQTRLCHRRG